MGPIEFQGEEKKMTRRTFRLGWLIAVMAMTAMACTCGALGQATSAVETAQALATAGQELATAAGEFQTEAAEIATQVATSGAIETLQAQATSSGVTVGEGPEDIPVYPGGNNVVGTAEALTYQVSATAQEVVDFYKAEMPNNGWEESQEPVATGPVTALTYAKDGREATVTVTEFGGSITVAIGITN